jgi:thiosulfate reductase cytochrome b subunit
MAARSMRPDTGRRRVLRHSLPVRIAHWTTALAILFLLLTGLNIFGAHPRLYWGDAGSVEQTQRQWLQVGVSGTMAAPQGWLDVGNRRFETTGVLGASIGPSNRWNIVAFPHWATFPSARDLATARTWHFFFAWVLIGAGLVYLVHGLLSGHIVRDLLPRWRHLAPRHIWGDVIAHLRLDFPKGEAALDYAALQRMAYSAVVLLLIPAIILTGMAMSPGLNAAFPWLDALWGGRQSARSVHFIAAGGIALFLAVHLLMVMLSGPVRQLGAMITGRLAIEEPR